MVIKCTKKLQELLKIKDQLVNPEEGTGSFSSWYGNVLEYGDVYVVALMEGESRYPLIFASFQPDDFLTINDLIDQGISAAFRRELIESSVTRDFLQLIKNKSFSKTDDRAKVAHLNAMCRDIDALIEGHFQRNQIVQEDLMLAVSQLLVNTNGYLSPKERMQEKLTAYFQRPLFELSAVQLKVTLPVPGVPIWRRLLVPAEMSFYTLHLILQHAFSWQDYHIHDFVVFSNNNPIVNLVMDKEAFEIQGDVPMKLEREKRLRDYFSICNQAIYLYDFGDDWAHYIEVEKWQKDYNHPYAVCLEGEGTAPPEDVGGAYGYLHFLDILEDTNHPEYEEIKVWAHGQRWYPFDVKSTNIFMKDIR